MSGEDQQFEGKLKTGQTVKVAYFKQTDETLDRDIRMIDYLREENEIAKEKMEPRYLLHNFLNDFYFQVQLMVKKFINYLVESKSVCIYYVYSYTSQMFCC